MIPLVGPAPVPHPSQGKPKRTERKTGSAFISCRVEGALAAAGAAAAWLRLLLLAALRSLAAREMLRALGAVGEGGGGIQLASMRQRVR